MKYISEEDLKQIRSGSFEEWSVRIEEAASQEFGAPVSLVATFEEGKPCTGISGEQLVRIEWERNGDEVSVVVEPFSGVLMGEEHIDRMIGEDIRESVRAMISGEPCNRLHELALSLRPDSVYLPSQVSRAMTEAINSSDWPQVYSDRREQIRSGLHGQLGEIESRCKLSKYAQMSDSRLGENAEDLRESMKRIGVVTDDVARSCRDLVFGESEDADFCDSLVKEAEVVARMAPRAAVIIEDLRPLARIHDMYAGRLQQMAVASAHLKNKATSAGEPDEYAR